MKNNWLKMYDKFGQVLRVETVTNIPREFQVRLYYHGLATAALPSSLHMRALSAHVMA